MQPPHTIWRWKERRLILRLGLAFILVPFSAPTLWTILMVRDARGVSFGDWAGIILLYTAFSFGAMVAFGTPLVYLYSRLNWIGFFPFIAGGAICAALTYLAVMRGHISEQLPIFTMFGVVEGLVFRLMLFGFRLHARTDA